jgi:hypothetical protein
MSDLKAYNGNSLLKQVGEQIEFGLDDIKEIQRCSQDPIYFIENYCKIVTLDHGLVLFKMYEFQKQLVSLVVKERKVVAKLLRQGGKTSTSAAIFVWLTLFTPHYTVAILANKGAAAREVLDRYQTMYENLPRWMQQGVITWNKGDVELENGSKVFTAATSVSGIRGKSVSLLFVDEAALIPNNIADQFFASVYPVISSGTKTKILISSTPIGYNHFWKLWTDAEAGKNGFIPFTVNYWDVPGRDEAWAADQLKTLGDVKFKQEIGTEFLGSSNTLISGAALAQMVTKEPIHMDKEGSLKAYFSPIDGHNYVIVADTARGIGGDYSAVSVFDVSDTPYVMVARYHSNTIAPMLLPDVILKLAKDYNNAYVLIETNDIGRQVSDILYSDLEYENMFTTSAENGKSYITTGFSKGADFGVRTNKSVKRIGCFAIKNIVEERKILIHDVETIFEMSTFIEKAGSFTADEGYHDDIMMTLVLFGWLTTNTYFKDLTNVDIRKRLYDEQAQNIQDNMTPFGFISDGLEEEEVFNNDNSIWSGSTEIPWKSQILGH